MFNSKPATYVADILSEREIMDETNDTLMQKQNNEMQEQNNLMQENNTMHENFATQVNNEMQEVNNSMQESNNADQKNNEIEDRFTFTKLSMILLYTLFVLGAVIGAVLTIWSARNDILLGLQIDSAMFIAYGAYIGAPTTIAISFYAWKSKSENLLKIHYAHKKLDPNCPELDINNLIDWETT